MKNLELNGLNLQELNSKELLDVEGGAYPWLWQSAVATFAYNVIEDWNANVAAFKRGNSGKTFNG
ncbi:MAG: hypothetical protein EAZ15_09865 [Sphingobacteriales bacterium]|nr:MAG: hypothetical protein EAZ15_09865 [Sphingobacteriales bacterium]